MLKGWIIYSRNDVNQNRSYIDWFIEEAALQDVALSLFMREELTIGIMNNQRSVIVDGITVPLPDFAVVRTIDSMIQLQLEALEVPCFNSSTIAQICNDKALTHHYIAKLGLPMVDTLFYLKDHLPDTCPLSYPCVVKEVTGRGGKQVYFIQNQQEWSALSNMLTNKVIIQSSNVQLGKDLRVFVVGKDIIGAVLRQSDLDFRANYKLGGTATLYHLSLEETSMIQKIIDHFDFGMVGIDFLFDKTGALLFNEIEDVVGSRILSAVSEINIVRKYISYIVHTLQ